MTTVSWPERSGAETWWWHGDNVGAGIVTVSAGLETQVLVCIMVTTAPVFSGLQDTGVADILTRLRATLPRINVVKGLKSWRFSVWMADFSVDNIFLFSWQSGFQFHFNLETEAAYSDQHLECHWSSQWKSVSTSSPATWHVPDSDIILVQIKDTASHLQDILAPTCCRMLMMIILETVRNILHQNDLKPVGRD